jgi:hypothetical protein
MIDLDKIPIYCIHLPHAKDREKTMFSELDYLRPNKDYYIINGVVDRITTKAISESFKNVIKKAITENHKQVIILEDDVKFTSKKSKEVLQKSLETIPSDWDILLCCSYYFKTDDDTDKPIIKIKDFTSLICAVYNNTSYEKILLHDNNKVPHIDRYLGKLSRENNLNVYLIYPMIAMEYPGISYNKNKEVDYTSMLSKYKVLKD